MGYNVIILLPTLNSNGIAKSVVNIANYLIKKNYSVTVLTLHSTHNDFFKLNCKIKRECLKLPIKNKKLSKIIDIKRIYQLRKILKKVKYDIILGIHTECALFSIIASWGLNTKILISERSYPNRKNLSLTWKILRKFLYRFSDCNVAQSNEAAKWFKDNTKTRNIIVIPNPACSPPANDKQLINPKFIVDKNDQLILSVGRIAHEKGYDHLIKTFSSLCNEIKELKLAIIGSKTNKIGLVTQICA
jgi:glycosyltransferase involved in cell wall biosynthesis